MSSFRTKISELVKVYDLNHVKTFVSECNRYSAVTNIKTESVRNTVSTEKSLKMFFFSECAPGASLCEQRHLRKSIDWQIKVVLFRLQTTLQMNAEMPRTFTKNRQDPSIEMQNQVPSLFNLIYCETANGSESSYRCTCIFLKSQRELTI